MNDRDHNGRSSIPDGDGSPIVVLGAGSWGTALAVLLAGNGSPTVLWGREPDHLQEMRRIRSNERYLPGIPFPDRLRIEGDLATAVSAARDIMVAVPSGGFRELIGHIATRSDVRLAWGTKGMDPGTGKLLHEVVEDVFTEPPPAAVLSGPTFAAEVARGLPTAVTLAASDDGFARDLSARLHSGRFRVYTSGDIVGVELGGAVKNVLAIAAGIADGLGFGANTRAALVTRGLTEIMRLGVAMGGQRETFMGLAGLGDLVLTCTDDQSRNRRFGMALGRGQSIETAIAGIGQIVEGVEAAREVARLARARHIDMPIAGEVHAVLYRGKDPHDAVRALFSREQKAETTP